MRFMQSSKAFFLALCLAVIAGCGGGDPFYSAPEPPFGTETPVARVPITPWATPVVRPAPAGPRVLVLYDQPVGGDPYARLGVGYATMLQNLLGHFDASVDLLPVADYVQGRIEQYAATFYIGWTTDEAPPLVFLDDVIATGKRVVWLRGDVQRIADQMADFEGRFGFQPLGLRWFDEGEIPDSPGSGFFSTIGYKDETFEKVRVIIDGQLDIDAAVYLTHVTSPAKARVWATMHNPVSGQTAPYVLQAGNFWLVADLPFNDIAPTDRYVVFADLLHDMLGIDHPQNHRAMVRLEDVDAMVNPAAFKAVVDALAGQGVPFTMAVIPHYKDPYGAQNRGVPQDIPLAQATTLRLALDYALVRGGEIAQHGYTHQSDDMINTVSGSSGLDFEFWDSVHNRPMPGDSIAWASGRILAGRDELLALGLRPLVWEMPHYIGSPMAEQAAAQIYPTIYGKKNYYTSEHPDLTPGPGADFEMYQFFPYLIERDRDGVRVLPETLSNIQYFQFGADEEVTAATMLQAARKLKVVRDGFASFFFHPFLVEGTGGRGMQDLQDIVRGLSALGYQWASPSQLGATTP